MEIPYLEGPSLYWDGTKVVDHMEDTYPRPSLKDELLFPYVWIMITCLRALAAG